MGKSQQERAVIDLVINGQQARTTLKEVSLAASRARSDLLKMKEADDPALYKAKLAEFQKLNGAQREMTARINDASTAWQRFKKEAATLTVGVVGGNVITFMLQQLVALIPSAIDRTMKLRDSFADIQKATGLSAEGVKKLNQELKQIDTRTSNADLRQIAVAGGQLGVANDELKEFVRNADMAVVALGDEFGGGVEQVTKELGGIGKLFAETRNLKAGEQLNVIGSAINELGAAGAATGPVIADFTTRMGALGDMAPTLAQTMGLGAALQELGVSAEIGASGLTGILTAASTQSELFAQHLGMSKVELKALIDTDSNAFLMKLARSFQGVAPTDVLARLKDLKVESQESAKVMSLLANQTAFVGQKQQLTAKATAEATSLANEFNKKNHQLAKDLKDLNEWFNSLFSSEAVENFLASAVHGAVEFTRTLPGMVNWFRQNKDWFYLLGVATLAYYGATIKATAATVANTVAEGYRKVAYELGFRWMIIMESASKAYALVTGVLTGAISLQTAALTIARTAWASLTAIMAANPVGAIIVGFTALYVVLKKFKDNTEDAIRVERQYQMLKQQTKMATDNHRLALDELNRKMAEYNNLSKEEQAQIKKTAALKLTEASARLANANAKAREMRNEAGRAEVTDEDLWDEHNLSMNFDKTKKRFELRQKRMRDAEQKALEGTDGLKAQIEENKRILEQIERIDNEVNGKNGGGQLRKITGGKAATETPEEKRAKQLSEGLDNARDRIAGNEQSERAKSEAEWARHYSDLYALAKKGTDEVKEIERLSLIERAQLEKQWQTEEQKAEEDRQKQVVDYAKKLGEQVIAESNLEKDLLLSGIDQKREKGEISDTNAQAQRLQIEQQALMAEYLIRQKFAMDTVELNARMNQNLQEQAIQRAKTEKEAADYIKAADKEWLTARQEIVTQGLGVLKSFFKENSAVGKAILVAQKAWAVAQIIIQLQQQMAAIRLQTALLRAQAAAVPGVGAALAIGIDAAGATKLASAKLAAGASIASIGATAIGELAGRASGGYTDIQALYGDPQGFVDGPTVFAQGRRSYLAGEAGREFVISNRALQQPAVADFARMLDVMQRSGNYSALAGGEASRILAAGRVGTTASDSGLSRALLLELQGINQQLSRSQATANRPVVLNYRLFEEFAERVEQIRMATSL